MPLQTTDGLSWGEEAWCNSCSVTLAVGLVGCFGYNKEVSSPDFGLVCRFAAVLDVTEAYFYAVDEDLATLILQ